MWILLQCGIKLQIYFSFTLVFVDVGSLESAANSSTAIGFDERMLLHAEVWFYLFCWFPFYPFSKFDAMPYY